MATKMHSRGDILTFTSGGTIASDDVVQFGQVVGVAQHAAVSGQQVEVAVTGVWRDMPKATGTAWVAGDLLYWSGTAFTKTASGNTPAGVAAEAAASGDATGIVRLNGSFAADPA